MATSKQVTRNAEIVELQPSSGKESSTTIVVHDSESSSPKRDTRRGRSNISKKFSGWRAGAYTAAILALVSLILNISAAIWLRSHSNTKNGLLQVYQGNCKRVSALDTAVHLLVNVISSLLLSGSNYCMQCLCAPTRKDVNQAHAKGNFLDIGVLSFRNLANIAGYKTVLWWTLALSSIPLHLLYNSAFYSAITTNDYAIYVVTPEFLRGGSTPMSKYQDRGYGPVAAEIQRSVMLNDTTTFQRLEVQDCIKQYATVLLQDWSNLIFVSPNASKDDNTVLHWALYIFGSEVEPGGEQYWPYDWICQSDPNIDQKIEMPSKVSSNKDRASCNYYVDKVEAVADQWQPFGFDVDYCLAQQTPQRCSLNGNFPIVIVVIVCNTIKLAVMLIVVSQLQDSPLITIGDAIQSFLDHPDSESKSMCLLTREDVMKYLNQQNRQTRTSDLSWKDALLPRISPQSAVTKSVRWSQAASRRRWCATVGLLLLAVVTVAGLLIPACNAVNKTGGSIWELGFGLINPQATVLSIIQDMDNYSTMILASVLIANIPQAILSFLYFNLNGLLTSMFVAREWDRYGTSRKFLRVSSPAGQQRSTHFLQIPYKFGIPLVIISALLHWIVSRAIFLVVVMEARANGTPVFVNIASCGFSPIAMVTVIIAGIVVLFGIILIGRQKYDSTIPLVGSCSIAISAACHPPADDINAATSAVRWGDVSGSNKKDAVGHCCFTSYEVEPVRAGRRYAGQSGTQENAGTSI